jgi:AcrR family transcriptional regulator
MDSRQDKTATGRLSLAIATADEGRGSALPPPPTRKGQETRLRLLVAADAVFGRLGYANARVADVVAEAGVSHGLFYRHFADIDSLLMAVLSRLNERLRHSSGRIGGEPLVPTLTQLQRRNILFFQEYAEHRLLLRVSREAAARVGGDFRTPWLQIRGRFVARTERWIDRLVAAGHIAPFEDPAVVAEGLSALTEQMAYVRIGLADTNPTPEAIDALGRACGLIWYATLFGSAR